MRALLVALALVFAIPAQARPVKVVASFSILGDMVRQVGGPEVEVATLVGPNSDTHVYQPSPADARTLAGADLVVINGLGLEGWMERLIQSSGYKGLVAVASAGVDPILMEDQDAKARIKDPHAWQDLANGLSYSVNIAKALAQAAPDRAQVFLNGAAAYGQRLRALDQWVRDQIESVPAPKRRIITSHDAFAYFGRAYHVELLAPVGLSTEAEPTAKDMARLVKQIREQHVKAVFLENMGDPRLVKQLSHDAGAVIGGTLFTDSLSAADGPAPTYEAMFRHNVTQLRQAMQKN